MSPYHTDDESQFMEHETWEHNSDYVPTPGYCASPYAAASALSPSPYCVLENRVDPKSRPGPRPLRFLPLHKWEEGRTYDEDPPACIHYRIEWRVTVNNREVSTDTEEDVVLAPSAFWQLSLEKKLEKALRRKTSRHRRAACDKFIYTENLVHLEDLLPHANKPTGTEIHSLALQEDHQLSSQLRTTVETASDDDGWARLCKVGQLLTTQYPDFDSRTYGYSMLSDLIAASSWFETSRRSPRDGLPNEICVRDKHRKRKSFAE
ncbi:hypothetical protein PEBR_07818 [Penicillium brasilianum]|uniref:HTH OST-type domain-containing protein n=1 Tax=Penicillium brasilianum TaxID=104259 RepID=A0A1S9RVP7_PENBI|nr:hypothetical protein PEBR_07818 [Penicillium brasilianum]